MYKPHYLIQFFGHAHLPDGIAEISARYADLANFVDRNTPNNPEKTMALRKLLEAKDCAVRSRLFIEEA